MWLSDEMVKFLDLSSNGGHDLNTRSACQKFSSYLKNIGGEGEREGGVERSLPIANQPNNLPSEIHTLVPCRAVYNLALERV